MPTPMTSLTNWRRDPYDAISARLKSVPEMAEEDLRNALQILVAWRDAPMPVEMNELVRLRIDSAMRKLGR